MENKVLYITVVHTYNLDDRKSGRHRSGGSGCSKPPLAHGLQIGLVVTGTPQRGRGPYCTLEDL